MLASRFVIYITTQRKKYISCQRLPIRLAYKGFLSLLSTFGKIHHLKSHSTGHHYKINRLSGSWMQFKARNTLNTGTVSEWIAITTGFSDMLWHIKRCSQHPVVLGAALHFITRGVTNGSLSDAIIESINQLYLRRKPTSPRPWQSPVVSYLGSAQFTRTMGSIFVTSEL